MRQHKARPDRVPNKQKLRERTTIRCLCGKVWSPSRSQAKKLFKKIDHHVHNTDQVWFYSCPHGGWHWTRMPPHRWPRNPKE